MSFKEYILLQIMLLIFLLKFIFDKDERKNNGKNFLFIFVINIFLILCVKFNINILDYFFRIIVKGEF